MSADPISDLAAQIRATYGSDGVNWNAGDFDQSRTLAQILTQRGITDLSKLSFTPEQITVPEYYQGGDETSPSVVYNPSTRYNLSYGGVDYGSYLGDISNSGEFSRGISDGSRNGTNENIGWTAAGHGNTNFQVRKLANGQYGIVPVWNSSSDAADARTAAEIYGTVLGAGAAAGSFGAGAATTTGATTAGMTAPTLTASDVGMAALTDGAASSAWTTALPTAIDAAAPLTASTLAGTSISGLGTGGAGMDILGSLGSLFGNNGIAGTLMTLYSANQYGKALDASTAAGAEAARMANDLGWAQLLEGRDQYNQNMAMIRPIVEAQVGAMNDQLSMAKDSYEYSKQFRPVEGMLLDFVKQSPALADAYKTNRDEIKAEALKNAATMQGRVNWFDSEGMKNLDTIGSGDTAILNGANGADIQDQVDRAVADSRVGQTAAENQAIRQAMRYGMNPGIMLGNTSIGAAQAQAGAATGARTAAVQGVRDRAITSMNARDASFRTSQAAMGEALDRTTGAMNNERNQRIQDEQLLFGRAMDVAGLGRGIAGMSTGAYAGGVNAGNSAASNQMAPGNQLLSSMAQGNNTIMQGQGMQIGALNNAANNQSGIYRQWANELGTIIGAGMKLGKGP